MTASGTGLAAGSDGTLRCWWAVSGPTMERYHDEEWGRGPRDEQGLFERLSLEAFQAGLSWRIVLERREALRTAFVGFDPEAVAAFTSSDVVETLTREGMIRNRAKVEAVVANARLLVELREFGIGLGTLTEEVVAAHPPSGRPPRSRQEVPATSTTSIALARRLRDLGWRFVGPTTAHAYLQAVGWVDDHVVGCVARRGPGDASDLR